MKRYVYGALSLLIAHHAHGAAHSDDIFARANEAFNRADYRTADELFKSFIDGNPADEQQKRITKVNRGQCLLARGIDGEDVDFAEAWELFEERIPLEIAQGKRAPLENPLKPGESVEGKVIRVDTEYGFGDTVTFIPLYCRALRALGAKEVIVNLTRPHHLLAKILEGISGVDCIITPSTPEAERPQSDAQVYAMSLPRLFSTKGYAPTTATTVMYPFPTDFKENSDVRRKYFEQMYIRSRHAKEDETFLDIAICWRASKNPVAGGTRVIDRNMPLALLTALAAKLKDQNISVHLWSVQGPPDKFVTASEYEKLKREGQADNIDPELDVIPDEHAAYITQVKDENGPFVDTAAVLRVCDAFVGVDTVFPNLAAAMGKTTYFMLKKEQCDMRWGTKREDTVWFVKEAKLLRQETEGDWSVPLAKLEQALKQPITLPTESAEDCAPLCTGVMG
jgi:hypothetical protein